MLHVSPCLCSASLGVAGYWTIQHFVRPLRYVTHLASMARSAAMHVFCVRADGRWERLQVCAGGLDSAIL